MDKALTTLSGIGLLVELRSKRLEIARTRWSRWLGQADLCLLVSALFRNNLSSSVSGTVTGQRSLVWPSVRFTFLSSILVWSLFRLMRAKDRKPQEKVKIFILELGFVFRVVS